MADEERGTSSPGTDDRGTANALLQNPLKTFDSSTWEDIEDDKERPATFKALLAIYHALREFCDARPEGKWRDRRIELDRLIKDQKYSDEYEAGYGRGKRAGLRAAFGQNAEDLLQPLARLELVVIFQEMLKRLKNPRLVTKPRRLRSNFVNGVKEMRIAFDPERG